MGENAGWPSFRSFPYNASYSINRVKGVIKSIYMTNARIVWLNKPFPRTKKSAFFDIHKKAKILGEKNIQFRFFGKIAYFLGHML